MSIYQLKVWQARCDRCATTSEPIFDTHMISPPEGWEYVAKQAIYDDSYAPSYATVLLCPACLKEKDPNRGGTR